MSARTRLSFLFFQTTLLTFLCLTAAIAQKYSGPRPAKPDIPYLIHADTLVATEVTEAKEEKRKQDVAYVTPGASSSAKTPLAGPIFIFQSEQIQPDKLQLYRFDVKNGNREVLVTHKGKFGPGNFVWFPEGEVMEHGASADGDVVVVFITNKPFRIDYVSAK